MCSSDLRYLLVEHEDELAATQPSRATHLLGAFDQFVLGPGTKDTHMLANKHRSWVSKAAGWIAPVLTQGGRHPVVFCLLAWPVISQAMALTIAPWPTSPAPLGRKMG